MGEWTELQEKAQWVRQTVLEMIHEAGSGHPGGSLSEVELLVYLYYHKMKINPLNPSDPVRDRFVLSKGHCCPSVYAILADLGYFSKDKLKTLRKTNTILQGHPSIITPGIDSVSGSLGNGLSVAVGMALFARKNHMTYKTYVIMGDGEQQEGAIWEAAMEASHKKLNNIGAILDYNKIQILGFVKDIVDIEPIEDKWRSFGWNVVRGDGSDFESINDCFNKIEDSEKPSILIMDTIKGKGVSFMENNCAWHGKAPNDKELADALRELKG